MQFSASLVALMASASFAAPTADTAAVELSTSLANLKSSYDGGYTQVGNDGVLRSFTANHIVIDYLPLSNTQIKMMLKGASASFNASAIAELHTTFVNVSGQDVTSQEQLTNPPDELLRVATRGLKGIKPASSDNPVVSIKKDLSKRTPACYGATCSDISYCVDNGCQLCIYLSVDAGPGFCFGN